MNATPPDQPADDPARTAQPAPEPTTTAPLIDLVAEIAIHTVKVGNYQLKRLIGSGGMGAVYEAVQDSPRRPVALKLMRNPLGSRSDLHRFQYESQLLARLRHPGIAEVYEAGTFKQGDASIPFYTMEFISGSKNIADYAQAGMLGVRQTIALFVKVCDAMQHAHSRGVIHRDLKPANILIDGAGEPKVIDFGIARALDSDQAPATLQTRPDQLLGTLQYMSPEQLDGDPSALDPRSDVYSMGVILYELLCGRLPYDVRTSKLHEASQRMRDHPPTAPRVIKPELSRDVEVVLLAALQKERSRRYQSAQALGDDLRRILEDLPVAARGDSASYRLRTRVRYATRHHRILAGLAVMLAAFVIAELLGRSVGGAGLNTAYERFLTNHLATPASQLRFVVVLAMHDKTDWPALAKEVGAGVIDPADVRTMRLIHAALMRKLIGTDARALAFDIQFSKQVPGIDEVFASAAQALRQDGTAIVCAAPNWRILPNGAPEISPPIARETRWGSLLAHLSQNEPWSIDLFLQPRTRQIMPSLTLASAAAYWNPSLAPTFEYDGAAQTLVLRFSGPMYPATAPLAVPIAQEKIVQYMRTRLMEFDRPEQGIAPTDVGGQYLITLPPTDVLDRSTLDYESVLRMTTDQRRALLSGKLIFVGDLRTNRDGPFTTPDGRKLAGVYAHAVAAEAILADSQAAARVPGFVLIGPFYFWGQYCFDLAAALAGALVAIACARRWALRWLWVSALMLFILIACLLSFRFEKVVVAPWTALLALPLAAELVALVERVRGEAGTNQAMLSLSRRRSQ